MSLFRKLIAFYADIHDRKAQIEGGIKQVCTGVAIAFLPLAVTGVWWGLGMPLPDFGGLEFLPIIALTGLYPFTWLPFFLGKAKNGVPMITGRKPTKALGGANFATRKDMEKRGHIGGSRRSDVYLGRMR
jgi:hypothetical protein